MTKFPVKNPGDIQNFEALLARNISIISSLLQILKAAPRHVYSIYNFMLIWRHTPTHPTSDNAQTL